MILVDSAIAGEGDIFMNAVSHMTLPALLDFSFALLLNGALLLSLAQLVDLARLHSELGDTPKALAGVDDALALLGAHDKDKLATATTQTITVGTLSLDMYDPAVKHLVWRGTASARLTEHPSRDVRALQRVARAIVQKFPRAEHRPVAAR